MRAYEAVEGLLPVRDRAFRGRLAATIAALVLTTGLFVTPAASQSSEPAAPAKPAPTVRQNVRAAGYYVEFRTGQIGLYGHSYAAYGRLDARGNPASAEYADLHPMGNYGMMALGHFVPVPANMEWNPEVLKLPISHRYRRAIQEPDGNGRTPAGRREALLERRRQQLQSFHRQAGGIDRAESADAVSPVVWIRRGHAGDERSNHARGSGGTAPAAPDGECFGVSFCTAAGCHLGKRGAPAISRFSISEVRGRSFRARMLYCAPLRQRALSSRPAAAARASDGVMP
jgi:hypothetical protein